MSKADCHIHMLLNGEDWRSAIEGHREGPDRELIRARLQSYAQAGFTYLRDGGDRWGVGAAAREMAPEFGITYRTPLSPLIRAGCYGAFIGKKYMNLKGYAKMVAETGSRGGDFIKIMISGLMDFDRFGQLSEESLDDKTIEQLIHIAHEEGFPVMIHANGARAVETAALAGADSIEHGAYLDIHALSAMEEYGTVWCPTLAPIGNLRGRGRFDDGVIQAIYDSAVENIRTFAHMGGHIVPGSDAGAWAVPHVRGGLDEYDHMAYALGEKRDGILEQGIAALGAKF